MRFFLDVITIPVGLLGLWAWWSFCKSWLSGHRRRIERLEMAVMAAQKKGQGDV